MKRSNPEKLADMDRQKISDLDRWGPWIAAVVLVAFMIWVLGVSIQQSVLDIGGAL